MTAPYIDGSGFHGIGLQGYLDDLTALWQSRYGTDISDADVQANATPDARLINGIAARFAALESLVEHIYEARSPAAAVGAGLSRLVQLNGITRKPASYSTAPVTLTGTPDTLVPAGSLIGSASDPSRPAFATTSDLTIGAGGVASGIAQCSVTGPVPGAAGDLTRILSVVTGWTAVINPEDAAPGANGEADPLLRIRRAKSPAYASQSLRDGLEAALLNLRGVRDARVYENTTGATDTNNLPGHSIKCVVAGRDAEIAHTIAMIRGMGATTVGQQSENVVDESGNSHLIRWDWATELPAYVVIKVMPAQTSSQLLFLSQQMGNAIAEYFSDAGPMPPLIGQNVAWFGLATPINALGLTGSPGLPDVAAVYLGNAPNPTTQADLAVAYNEIAVFDPSRIAVINGP